MRRIIRGLKSGLSRARHASDIGPHASVPGRGSPVPAGGPGATYPDDACLFSRRNDMRTNIRRLTTVAALGAALFGMASAGAAGLPPAHMVNGIETLSGGIGDGQAAAMQAAAPHWPLTLEFAIRDHAKSDYAADVKVVVRNAKGDTVLKTTAGGPFLLARLDPGRYTV